MRKPLNAYRSKLQETTRRTLARVYDKPLPQAPPSERSWRANLLQIREAVLTRDPREERGCRNSLFIATWSISETPLSVREEMMPFLRRFEMFLIAFQHRFHEMDNLDFFHRWKNEFGDTAWQEWEIGHLVGNSYLAGNRKAQQRGAP